MKPLALLLAAATLADAAPHDDLLALIENGHWRKARALADERLKPDTQDGRLLWLGSRVRLAFSDLEGAARLAEKAVEIEPRNADYHFQLVEVYGSQAQAAGVLRQMGLGRKTKKEIDTVLALDPKHAKGLGVLMMYLYRAPGIIGGDKEKARQIPSDIGKFDAAQGYMAQVRLNAMENKREANAELYRKAAEANPDHYEAHSGLASTYLGQQKFDMAVQHAREMIRIRPERMAGWSLLAYAMGRQDKPTEAEKVIADAAARIPGDRTPSLSAAVGLLDAGRNFDKAESWIRSYLAVEPEPLGASHAHARWRLAQLYEKSGRKQEAMKELEAAARQDPRHEGVKRDLKRLRG